MKVKEKVSIEFLKNLKHRIYHDTLPPHLVERAEKMYPAVKVLKGRKVANPPSSNQPSSL